MATYWINTPIKVSRNKIIQPGGKPVSLADKIVRSLPPHAVTLVDEPKPEKPESEKPESEKP